MVALLYNFIYILAEMSPYLLLGFLVAGILSQIIPTSWVQRHLAGKGYSPIVKSAMIGVPLPLCSCGVIPVMASLRKQGANIPAMLSFILSTPQTGVDSILATYALLGLPLAIYRPFIALITALVGGSVYYWLNKKEVDSEADTVNKEIEKNINGQSNDRKNKSIFYNLSEMFHYGFITLPKEISRTLIFGVIIASIITTFIPPGTITQFLNNNILQIFIAILVGIPLYVCATASIPVALSLIHLGASPGSALAFLIAGPATNIATISIVKQFLGKKAVIIYILVMVLSALFFGITFDYLISYFPILDISRITDIHHSHDSFYNPVKIVSFFLFGVVLLLGFFNIDPWIYFRKSSESKFSNIPFIKVKINDMTCSHCAQRITTLIKNISNVIDIEISLENKTATIYGNPSIEEVKTALKSEGYSAELVEKEIFCNCR